MTDQLKALSIHQPWAWMIVNGWKPIENRDWATRFRGRFLVHASKAMTRGDYDDASDTMKAAWPADWPIVKIPDREWFVTFRGGIIGDAEVVDCIDHSESPWFFGKFGFVLANAKPLPFRPCLGKLGFFIP